MKVAIVSHDSHIERHIIELAKSYDVEVEFISIDKAKEINFTSFKREPIQIMPIPEFELPFILPITRAERRKQQRKSK